MMLTLHVPRYLTPLLFISNAATTVEGPAVSVARKGSKQKYVFLNGETHKDFFEKFCFVFYL